MTRREKSGIAIELTSYHSNTFSIPDTDSDGEPRKKKCGQKLWFFQRHTVAMLTELGVIGYLIQEDAVEYEPEINGSGS